MSRKLSRTPVALLLFVAALTAACSNGGTTTTTGTTPVPSGPASSDSPCPSATALPSPPTLPGGFPIPAGVTLTGVEQAGPSTIVSGAFTGDLDQAFEGFMTALSGAGFTIEGSEQEEDDAEIEFEGAGTNGQVRLGEECEGRVEVTITIRPA